jgi:hypothetical protein
MLEVNPFQLLFIGNSISNSIKTNDTTMKKDICTQMFMNTHLGHLASEGLSLTPQQVGQNMFELMPYLPNDYNSATVKWYLTPEVYQQLFVDTMVATGTMVYVDYQTARQVLNDLISAASDAAN